MYDPQNRRPIIVAPAARGNLVCLLERLGMFVLTGVVWFFFIRYIYEELTADAGATGQMLTYLSVALALAAGALLYWQVFNYLMYAKKGRRKAFPSPSKEKVAAIYGIEVPALDQLQSAREAALRAEDRRYYLVLEQEQKFRVAHLEKTESS